MSDNDSIFADDWRESLAAHYKDVVRRGDDHTEHTLVSVLHALGFREDDLRQLKIEATMRAEDVSDDFVPDLDIDKTTAHAGVSLRADEAAEDAPPEPSDDEDDDPDAPQQMSLF